MSERSGTDPSHDTTRNSEGEDAGLGAVPEEDTATLSKTVVTSFNSREERLIGWNVDILLRLLKELTARRAALDIADPGRRGPNTEARLIDLEINGPGNATMVADEVKEVIELPGFNAVAYEKQQSPDDVVLPFLVEEEVRDFVRAGESERSHQTSTVALVLCVS